MQEVVLRLDTEGIETAAVEAGCGATMRRISPRNAKRIHEFADKSPMKKRTSHFAKVASVEILSDAVNYVVLKNPGRNFSGIVIQGDSLAKLYRRAAEVCRLAEQSGDEDLHDEAATLSQELAERLAHYEHVLSAYGIEIPYASPIANKVAK